jgi:hypothetical protein
VAVRQAARRVAAVHQAVERQVAVPRAAVERQVAVPRAAVERLVACPTLVVAALAVVRVVSPLPVVPAAARRAEDLLAVAVVE